MLWLWASWRLVSSGDLDVRQGLGLAPSWQLWRLWFCLFLLRYNSYASQFIHLKRTTQWFLIDSQNCATVTTVDLFS